MQKLELKPTKPMSGRSGFTAKPVDTVLAIRLDQLVLIPFGEIRDAEFPADRKDRQIAGHPVPGGQDTAWPSS